MSRYGSSQMPPTIRSSMQGRVDVPKVPARLHSCLACNYSQVVSVGLMHSDVLTVPQTPSSRTNLGSSSLPYTLEAPDSSFALI